jgi:hypothetical protein
LSVSLCASAASPVAVKRVVDYNVKVRAQIDQTGVDIANVKMSMNPFGRNRWKRRFVQRKASLLEIIAVSCGVTAPRNLTYRHGHWRRSCHFD